jgi:hypothetical protein
MAVCWGSRWGWNKGPNRFSNPALPTHTPKTDSKPLIAKRTQTSQEMRRSFKA